MITTKTEILALLKRNGGHSVNEIAESLHLAPITIRQHLTHLQRDGVVGAEQKAQRSGRPMHLFQLTAKGHAAAFPRRSDRLVELLLREVGLLSGREIEGLGSQKKTSLVLERLAQRLADEYVPLLQGWPLSERVVFVAEVMRADGGFVEWEATENGYEIRDFNCLFHRLVDGEGETCVWHRTFLSRMLGAEVRVTPCTGAGAPCCQYAVETVETKQPVVAHKAVH